MCETNGCSIPFPVIDIGSQVYALLSLIERNFIERNQCDCLIERNPINREEKLNREEPV